MKLGTRAARVVDAVRPASGFQLVAPERADKALKIGCARGEECFDLTIACRGVREHDAKIATEVDKSPLRQRLEHASC